MNGRSIAIIGGGPAALLTYKRLAENAPEHFIIDIFEKSQTLGQGMPYSTKGASFEHVTNVSSNELPVMEMELSEWVKALPEDTLKKYSIDRKFFHEKKVLPRLLFGEYLSAQFDAYLKLGERKGITTNLHYNTEVADIFDNSTKNSVDVITLENATYTFDYVVVCTGHHWPVSKEKVSKDFFDSPYPPLKLAKKFNHEVVLRGSSLTAVDAIRTMARNNGKFDWKNSKLVFTPDEDSSEFRVSMHSRHGFLPCIRVHMEEPHTAGEPLIAQEQIDQNIKDNDGFLQLDFLFEQGFKLQLKDSDPAFFEKIKDMTLEQFVEKMMGMREALEPFALFRKEYEEAEKSIDKERPVYWKEMLSALSFAMNYPAKHFSAEDMLRLQKHLAPLISVVIAFIPQESSEELMALNDAGRLDLIADGGDGGKVDIAEDGRINYSYEDEQGNAHQIECQTFVDCSGQKHLSVEDFPFKSLVEHGVVTGARVQFRDRGIGERLFREQHQKVEKDGDDYFLQVSGASISDNFQLVDKEGSASNRIYLMAVPYMGGFNPDYSGLDFCEHASELVVGDILKTTIH